MVETIPRSEQFNEEEFVRNAEATIEKIHLEKEGFILSQLENTVDQEAARKFLSIDQELLQQFEPYRQGGFIVNALDGMQTELEKAHAREEDSPLEHYWLIGYDEKEKILSTLEKEYGASLGPLAAQYEKELVFDVRALALWTKYAKGEDSVRLAREGLMERIASDFLREQLAVPPKLKILLTEERVDKLREQIFEDEQTVKEEGQELSHHIADEIEKKLLEKQSKLEESGTHQKFTKKLLEQEHEEIAGEFSNLVSQWKQDIEQNAAERDLYLKTCNDPRELADLVLGVKNGKLGGVL